MTLPVQSRSEDSLNCSPFKEFFRLPNREASTRSWTVSRKEIEAKNYDLKAVNPKQEATKTNARRTS